MLLQNSVFFLAYLFEIEMDHTYLKTSESYHAESNLNRILHKNSHLTTANPSDQYNLRHQKGQYKPLNQRGPRYVLTSQRDLSPSRY